jgi:hypothetical protein
MYSTSELSMKQLTKANAGQHEIKNDVNTGQEKIESKVSAIRSSWTEFEEKMTYSKCYQIWTE